MARPARARPAFGHLLLALLAGACMVERLDALQAGLAFPGVARELASFCSARPSLSIDLAPMLVHVKRNTSFNYKLYLFSGDEHVFQTGQIVPRDDFKIHSFPVKLRHLSEFVPVGKYAGARQVPLEVYRLSGRANGTDQTLVPVPSASFKPRQFFAQVPLAHAGEPTPRPSRGDKRSRSAPQVAGRVPHDVQGDALPGEESYAHHDAAARPDVPQSRPHHLALSAADANEHIEFDRDDQLAMLSPSGSRLRDLERSSSGDPDLASQPRMASRLPHNSHQQVMVMPVGSFSSFRVNSTYLVRKDFDQTEPELVRFRVDSQSFQVSRIDLLQPVARQAPGDRQPAGGRRAGPRGAGEEDDKPQADDYAFLSHKLLRDANTRITSISQIYEDWITRNFYTIVYIQRRPEPGGGPGGPRGVTQAADELEDAAPATAHELLTDRLVFRGSSAVLLGADQLDYHVKASAFITEKNGLHYYMEFLPNGKFYLGAIDWTKRPFKFIDAQRFPIKQTRTQLDNEELLLCPPSVCYSEQPVDELVAYGRLPLGAQLQREAAILARSSSSSPAGHAGPAPLPAHYQTSDPISLDGLVETMRAGAGRLDLRLHLRDWAWQLPRHRNETAAATRFAWHYEWARRNEIKVAPDTYGYALTGHEIDASYRVFNELYLISANQLIAINYTLANETVTSVHPIEEEFAGLSSSLLDPITGAFYDRYSNQIYFFKGERYVGYDYATRRPLEDFLLPPALDESLGGLGLELMMRPPTGAAGPPGAKPQTRLLVSSLPVVGMLGRQHQVDAIYHDLHEDVVYVFAGMKFYTHQASDFKDGAFRPATADQAPPRMRCINEHFLSGCRFDAAYPNPCRDEEHVQGRAGSPSGPDGSDGRAHPRQEQPTDDDRKWAGQRESSFGEEQQMKLRAIAARGGGVANSNLMDFLLKDTLLARDATRAIEPFLGDSGAKEAAKSMEPEQIVVYLLAAMVLVTVLVTGAMIVLVVNWAKLRTDEPEVGQQPDVKQPPGSRPATLAGASETPARGRPFTERPVYPAAISQYLSSQYQQQVPAAGRQRPPAYYYTPQSVSRARRLGGYGPPLTSPPLAAPPPLEPRRQYKGRPDQFGPRMGSSIF